MTTAADHAAPPVDDASRRIARALVERARRVEVAFVAGGNLCRLRAFGVGVDGEALFTARFPPKIGRGGASVAVAFLPGVGGRLRVNCSAGARAIVGGDAGVPGLRRAVAAALDQLRDELLDELLLAGGAP